MKKKNEFNITPEFSDSKGMLDAKTIIKFLPRAIKAVCEIKLSKGFGSGFFCKIPYTENDNLLLPVLITNGHVISEEILNYKNDIEIIIDGETKIISLNQRKIWNDKEMDFTCIEIKEKEDNIHTFFYLDDNVLDNNSDNNCYINKNVIVYGINKIGKKVSFSNGIIEKNEDRFFDYTCKTFQGFSGGCIVNQSNNNVIGIHRGEIDKKGRNSGIYIRSIIKRIKNNKAKFILKVN
jgi:V8-like Glu-specific endopeptidase